MPFFLGTGWGTRRVCRAARGRCAGGLFLALGLFVSVGADDHSALRQAVDRLVAQPRYATARWGLHVVALDTGEVWLSHDADRAFVPASNTKLFTAALALDRLGPEFRIHTSLLARRPPDDRGVLRGDLVVFGRGDFSWSDRFHDGWVKRALAPLVEAVQAAGVRRIAGDLVTDDRFFRAPAHGVGWEWDDFQYAYAAEVGALNVLDNVVRVHVRPGAKPGAPARAFLEPATDFVRLENRARTGLPGRPNTLRVFRPLNENRVVLSGSVPLDDPGQVERVAVHRPGAWLGRLLAARLRAAGVRLDGQARHWDEDGPETGEAPAAWREIGGVDSPPLRELLPAMLRPSQNQYAQLLWLQVGALTAPGPARTNEAAFFPGDDAAAAAAREAMRDFVARIGLPPDAVDLEEGSGLSRRNQVTPRAVTTLLRHAARQPWGGLFRAALPAPGEGTLAHRLRDLPPVARLRAKTGYLRHTYALSGYLITADGCPLAFACFLNHAFAPPDTPSPREDLDALVRLLATARSHR